jgi:metacaspase-1
MKRRHFLQGAYSGLTALALNQGSIYEKANDYGKVLAQGTRKKVALLVGINEYPLNNDLGGCENDIELQRHLLIYRFGFNPKDIHTLVNSQATRQGILDAFVEYLINPVRPGDVAVFHFSGHGSRVYDPHPIIQEGGKQGGKNATLIPSDGFSSIPEAGNKVNHIMGHTLFLLTSAIKTENFTAVLDCCFSGGATRNQFRVRSIGEEIFEIIPEEIAYQDKWLSKLNINSREEFVRRYRQGVARGVMMAASNPKQLALEESPEYDFPRGLFTYNLIRNLWKENSSPDSAIKYVNSYIQNLPKQYAVDQTPRYEIKKGSTYDKQPIYFTKPISPESDGVILDVKGQQVIVWLGGINIGDIKEGMQFFVINSQSQTVGKASLQSFQGIKGNAILEGNVTSGMFLRLIN